MSLAYCDPFFNLETTTESALDTTINAFPAVTASPLDFDGEIEAFLQSDDGSASTEEVPEPTLWNSPQLPRAGRKSNAQSYIEEVLVHANKEKIRRKRVRVGTTAVWLLLPQLISTSSMT
jgi:hypothetical protein